MASGSGLVAIAAALAGAASVTAVDIDPTAVLAVGVNAEANGVSVATRCADVLAGTMPEDVLLAGDVCYDPDMAARIVPFLTRVVASGALVLVGDPGRGYLPSGGGTRLATYPVPLTTVLEGRATTPTSVWRWGEPNP
jgi:predicted nicotinamide N-methyase